MNKSGLIDAIIDWFEFNKPKFDNEKGYYNNAMFIKFNILTEREDTKIISR